jgi:hypothetical protein
MENKLKIIVVVLFIVIIASAVFGAYEMEIGPFEEDDDDDDDNVITPQNDPKPIAVITTNSTQADVDELIMFSGSDSTDKESNITKYRWNFDDSDTAENETVEHSWITPGAYNVTLTVEDTDRNSNVTWVWIGVSYREDQNGNTNGDTETFDFSMADMASAIYVNTTLSNGGGNIGDNNVTVRISFDGTVVDEQTLVVNGGGGEVDVFFMNETNLTAGTWTWELIVNDSGLNCDLDWDTEVAILYS